MRAFFRRWSLLPFDVLIGQLVLVTGILGLLRVGGVQQDALSLLLSPLLLSAIQVLYAVAGALQLLGIGLGRPEIEGPSLVLLAASGIIRGLGIVTVAPDVGLSRIVVPVLFQFLVLIAAGFRLRILLHGEYLFRARRQ